MWTRIKLLNQHGDIFHVDYLHLSQLWENKYNKEYFAFQSLESWKGVWNILDFLAFSGVYKKYHALEMLT